MHTAYFGSNGIRDKLTSMTLFPGNTILWCFWSPPVSQCVVYRCIDRCVLKYKFKLMFKLMYVLVNCRFINEYVMLRVCMCVCVFVCLYVRMFVNVTHRPAVQSNR